jgi:FkbM family methyltransferase
MGHQLRGVQGIANRLAGTRGDFEISIGGAKFAGNLGSFIDRQAYLFGGYERDLIDLFLSRVPSGGTVLDVGANVGNHTVLFATHFDRVIAFEPNPSLWPALERNIALNPGRRIECHRVGLSDVAADLPLYNIDNGNLGLATFSSDDQYDKPLQAVTMARVEKADDLLGDIEVRAVKIDVQGFEPQVLRGMSGILARCRPVVWAEFGTGTVSEAGARADVESLFPYPIRIEKFVTRSGRLRTQSILQPFDEDRMSIGNYLIVSK